MGDLEDFGPLLALPVVFLGVQKVADLLSGNIAPGVDLPKKTEEELQANPPKPLTDFLPKVPGRSKSSDSNDFYSPTAPLTKYFPLAKAGDEIASDDFS